MAIVAVKISASPLSVTNISIALTSSASEIRQYRYVTGSVRSAWPKIACLMSWSIPECLALVSHVCLGSWNRGPGLSHFSLSRARPHAFLKDSILIGWLLSLKMCSSDKLYRDNSQNRCALVVLRGYFRNRKIGHNWGCSHFLSTIRQSQRPVSAFSPLPLLIDIYWLSNE